MSQYRKLARALFVGALALVLAAPAAAQQTESRIVGRISDANGGVLPGVTVTITAAQTGAVRTAVTDADGRYTVTNLAPGEYEVRVELSGFAPNRGAIALGAGDTKPLDLTLGVAGVSEAVTVSADVTVLDTTSAKLGVNVSPEELRSLPVNGRNFANLMTLATGATTDGNGGWSSVRFNGKSNQQNYLNYDGVDGTYVWDASPGYLNATGSQFRLQTSMESIAEFRVNSGLAPAESGLGSGGNITVISKSGSNRFNGSIFNYFRNDALDSASKYDDKKQQLDFNQFGGSLGGPIAANKTFFFGSYEGLKQETGLSFTEAVPSAEAIRRIQAGEPVGSGQGQSPDRTRAVAPLLAGFPQGSVSTANPLLALATLDTEAEQTEHTFSGRIDHRFTNNQSFFARVLYSDGKVDTPDRTVTPRRVLATQQPMNAVFNYQSLFGGNIINEVKVGYNRPRYDAIAFGPQGYDATQVSLSGTVTSQSIDARGSTGIARSGLLVRATSNASTNGQAYDPRSIALSDTLTLSSGAHTFKVGGEYRNIESQFRFLGSNEITYAGINEFIDNRPTQVAVSLESPVFVPQQYYLIGFVQDTWRATSRLTLELGLRYDFYSVVQEKSDQARPFFIEENAFSDDPDNFYNADRNNISPRLSAVFQINDKTALRAGYGLFYGPGQFEDRIQPIENFIERRRVQSTDVPGGALAYPVDPAVYRNLLSVRGYTHERPDEYNVQYGVSLSRELPAAINLTVGYTGSKGRDMFLRGVANTFDNVTRQRPVPAVGQVDYKTSACVDGLVINGNPLSGCGEANYDALQIGFTRRFLDGFTGGFQYQVLAQRGHDAGLERSRDGVEHLRLHERVRPQPDRHPAHLQRLARLPAARRGLLVRRLAHRRHRQRAQRRADQRDDQPPGYRLARRRHRHQHPGRQHPRHAAAGSRAGCRSLPQGWRALAEPGGVRGADAGHVRQPAAELSPRPVVLAGRPDGEQGIPLRVDPGRAGALRDVQHHQPVELREPGRGAPGRHHRPAVHRCGRRHVRLHAGSAQPDGRARHRAPDADRHSVSLLTGFGARGSGLEEALLLRASGLA